MVGPIIYSLEEILHVSYGGQAGNICVLILYRLNFCFLAKLLFDTHTYLRNAPFQLKEIMNYFLMV